MTEELQSKASISVVIPTYNRAIDLVKAVNSALQQTYPVTEVLVCDDGSSDNSKELITALNDPKVKWIDCGKNGGPAIPRNIGVKQSSGNWIAFLDSDDSWVSKKLEKQMDAIQQMNVNAACSNASRIRKLENHGAYSSFNKKTISLVDLFYQNSVICSSVLVSKEVLLKCSLFPESKTFTAIEDYALWVRVATQTDFAYLDECLVNYFDNFETSIRSEHSNDTWTVFEVIFSDFKEWINTKHMTLDTEQKKEFKLLFKRIKQKGIPTASEEFFRKLRDKLGIKTN
jgi:teichuronic acid biosynthesis glycosyltransferase TuaG